LVDKANVLASSRLWRSTVTELHQKHYSTVDLDYLFVDNAAMQLILNPSQFDVILTGNLFGDIISDEASVIGGSIGLLASASVGDKYALFEPIHGSFPQGAGKGIANPIATILSAAMMLEHFDMHVEAKAIQSAVNNTINNSIGTPDISPEKSYTTTEVGSHISKLILQ
jgi:3-isopropylmalate dehydrogenase